ncbi:PIN domain nuclease [Kitasatospora sp. LaBMicrA B282]|uniref:PIN domain nuclease n=1 Tax=Kitasatospora sp. LaBMicrA B282 TaxID=3420949 RepID=UPI003D0CC77B
MTGYLIDTSAMWRILRDQEIQAHWLRPLEAGLVRLCSVTKLEYLYSADGPAHRDEMEEELTTLFAPVPMPKDAWRWAENAQYKLTQKGQHRGPGPADLLLCATAVHHGLTILHDDNDIATVSRILPEVVEIDVCHRGVG